MRFRGLSGDGFGREQRGGAICLRLWAVTACSVGSRSGVGTSVRPTSCSPTPQLEKASPARDQQCGVQA